MKSKGLVNAKIHAVSGASIHFDVVCNVKDVLLVLHI